MFPVVPWSTVSLAQALLFAVLPAWALGRRAWRDAGEWWFAAVATGMASAALAGRACAGRGVGVWGALGIWLAGWLAVGWLSRRGKGAQMAVRWDGWLAAVLLLAWGVRSIHPLQTWALGQSDAYSHLGFLTEVLQRGRMSNFHYPPGHAWVMAFPARLLGGHPYWVARFGGAFFGVGLALGTYALAACWKGRRAGLAAAALVAGCPVFYHLQKTGVGVFANQLGLLLLVAAAWAFSARRFALLALALAALAVSVPMMLLHALALLALWTLAERRTPAAYAAMAALLVVGAGGMVALSMMIPTQEGMVVAAGLTGDHARASIPVSGWGEVFRLLASDFFSIKRFGYGSWILNVAALATAGLFAGALWRGMRAGAGWRFAGLWGLLTCANLHLGVLQFSEYQREGWSFLLALACLCGLAFDELWRAWGTRAGRCCLGGALACACLAGLAVPPSHPGLYGPAESDLVKYALGMDPAIPVLVRRTTPFVTGQGDVVRTLHGRTSHRTEDVPAGVRFVFLRDEPAAPGISGAMRRLQPSLVEAMEEFAREAEDENRRLEESLDGMVRREERVSAVLSAWHVEPIGLEKPETEEP